MKKLQISPSRAFSIVSLVLVTAMVGTVSLAQSTFFYSAVIDREAAIINGIVAALAEKYLSPREFEEYETPAAKKKFADAFLSFIDVTGVVRIKAYNRDNVVVWSDEPSIIGVRLVKSSQHLAQMWAGRPSGIFDPTTRPSFVRDNLPKNPLIEFYVPIPVPGTEAGEGEAMGVVAVYFKADSLVGTLRRGTFVLNATTFVGGAFLFMALFYLFRSVRRHREVKLQFARLSGEHERVVQMEKLSAIGHMLTEIAHQFNNPLVGVINLAQLAQREADHPDRVRQLLGEILKAGNHCSTFMQRMLRFGQLARCEPQRVELAGLVRDTLAFFLQSAGNRTPVEFNAGFDDVVLMVDPVLIRHALFNLINNAVQAAPNGIVKVDLAPELRDGIAGWAIAVDDTGPGISPHVMKHLFTPFFSTRQDGTGLGLAVAYQIVAQHGGHLRAENKPGGGARFVIWLPTTRESDEAENPAG